MFEFLRKPEFRMIETQESHLGGSVERNYQVEYKDGFFSCYKSYKYLYSRDVDKQCIFQKSDGTTLIDSRPVVCLKPYEYHTTTVQHSKDELEVVKFIMEVLQIIHSHKRIIDKYSFQTFSPLVMFIENNCQDNSNNFGEIYLINQLDREIYNKMVCLRCFCLSNIKNRKIIMDYLDKELVTSVKTEKYYL